MDTLELNSETTIEALDYLSQFCAALLNHTPEETIKIGERINDLFPETHLGFALMTLAKRNNMENIRETINAAFDIESQEESEEKLMEVYLILRNQYPVRSKIG